MEWVWSTIEMPGQGWGQIRVEAHIESPLLELPVTSGTLTFTAGETTKTIAVPTAVDTVVFEPDPREHRLQWMVDRVRARHGARALLWGARSSVGFHQVRATSSRAWTSIALV